MRLVSKFRLLRMDGVVEVDEWTTFPSAFSSSIRARPPLGAVGAPALTGVSFQPSVQ
jgi:hypothetical protein